MLILTNDHVRVEVSVERGAEITAIVPAHTGTNVLAHYDWRSPVPADGVTDYGDSELNWLSGYRGGWQETAPNVGAASHLNGMPLPFHGEASYIPWSVVQADEQSCVLEVHLRPTLRLRRTMTLLTDRPGLRLTSTAVNTGVQDVPMVWGQHPAFACDEDTTLVLPPGRYSVDPDQRDGIATTDGEWPAARTDDGDPVDLSRLGVDGSSRLIYRHGHDQGWAVVRQDGELSHVAMAWDINAYPAIWIWQNLAHPGFPWFGRMRCLAVEPQRAWPLDGLAGARERGQDIKVPVGGQVDAWIVMSFPSNLPDLVDTVTSEGVVVGQ